MKGMLRVKLKMLFALASVLAVLASVAVAAPTATVGVQVGGDANVFIPPNITISVGDTVKWTNAGGYHNVVADDGSFVGPGDGSPDFSAWEYSYTFNSPGTYTYYCSPHLPNMVGKVIVEGDASYPVYLPLVGRAAGSGL